MPRNVDDLQELEKTRKRVLPKSLQKGTGTLMLAQ